MFHFPWSTYNCLIIVLVELHWQVQVVIFFDIRSFYKEVLWLVPLWQFAIFFKYKFNIFHLSLHIFPYIPLCADNILILFWSSFVILAPSLCCRNHMSSGINDFFSLAYFVCLHLMNMNTSLRSQLTLCCQVPLLLLDPPFKHVPLSILFALFASIVHIVS
jgi:hypothetical protein